jgi:hypothetical protein
MIPAKKLQINMAQTVACRGDLTVADNAAIIAVKGSNTNIKLTMIAIALLNAAGTRLASR